MIHPGAARFLLPGAVAVVAAVALLATGTGAFRGCLRAAAGAVHTRTIVTVAAHFVDFVHGRAPFHQVDY